LIEVKIDSISQSKVYLGARSLRIKLDSKTVTTPSRVLTSSDIRKKRYVPTQIPLTNEIVLLDIPIDVEALIEPSKEANSKIKNAIKKLESFYGDLHGIHYLIPYIYPSGKKKEKVLKDKNLVEKALTTISLILHPSIDADYLFDIVCIHPFMVGYKDYIDVLRNSMKTFEKNNQLIIPVIDIAYPYFPRLIKELIDTYDVSIVGVKYRKIKNYLTNYAYLYNEFQDKDVAFLIVDVERRVRLGVKDFALPHYMPMFGFDLVTSRLSYGRFPGKVSFDFRLLDRAKLQLPLIDELDEPYRFSLFKELDVDLDHGILSNMIRILTNQDLYEKTKDEIKARIELNDNRESEIAREKYMRLYSLTRMQEIKASTNEFFYLRDFVRRGEIDEYYNKRDNLKIVAKRINIPRKPI